MRPTSIRLAVALFCAVGVLVSSESTTAQNASASSTTTSIALGVGSPVASVDALDARIATMLAAGELVQTSSIADPLDAAREHQYFAQRHGGVPVLGGGVSRQRLRGQTISAFGTLYSGIQVEVLPLLSSSEGASALQRVSGNSAFAVGSAPKLGVLPTLDGSFRLTYQATFADGKTRFIDAGTGELVLAENSFVNQQSSVGTGLGTFGDNKKLSTTSNGISFQPVDSLRPALIVTRSTQGTSATEAAVLGGAGSTPTDSDNVWTNPALVDAHVHTGWMYDYLSQRQNWAGLDGQNSAISQVVVDRTTIQNNAFFNPPQAGNTGVIAFGVSTGNLTFATLDVVGHELMHGVTFFSVRRRTGSGFGSALLNDGLGPTTLVNAGQTLPCASSFVRFGNGTTAPFLCQNGQYVLASNHGGATNEGFSDVFGAAVEFRYQPLGNAPLRSDYLQGEDLMPGGPAAAIASGLVRSLSDPASIPLDSSGVVRYPDHYDRRLRFLVYTQGNVAFLTPFTIVNNNQIAILGGDDNGGVHYNATLIGHIFYLAVEGGTNRTSGRSVPGVGFTNREQIEKIFFRGMTQLMPVNVTFPIVGAVLRQAAIDLYGSNSAAYRAMDGALLAVGL